MKASLSIPLLFLPLVVPLSASVAVISNLNLPGQSSATLRSSDGNLLPTGCTVRLVTFPDTAAVDLPARAAGGATSLLDIALLFGTASTVGTGSGSAGEIEIQMAAPLDSPLQDPHLLVTNADASEVLLLRLPQALPADDLTGPESLAAFHLDDAEVVFGNRDEQGFQTVVSPAITPSTYATWILSELGNGAAEADLAVDADADRDGVVNLIEYATGSKPGDGSSMNRLLLRRAPDGVMYLQYLRRTDDPLLGYTAESITNGGSGPWLELTGAPLVPAVLPSTPPPSFEWVELPLPAGDSLMARLRVEIIPE